MAGFCTSCGKPLPENGVCACKVQQQNAPQQPVQQQPYPQQPYAQQPYAQQPYAQQAQPVYIVRPQGPSVFSNYMKVLTGYFKDPVGTTRTTLEKKDITSGGITMAAAVLFTLLGTLFFTLVRDIYDFGDVVPAWIVVSIFGPAIAYGVTFGVLFMLAKLAKINVDPIGLLSAVGISSVLPVILLAASMLLGMASAVVFEILAVLMFAAWIVNVFTLIFHVLNIKMNIVNTLLLIVCLAAAYYMIVMLLNWLLFDGYIVAYIGSMYP